MVSILAIALAGVFITNGQAPIFFRMAYLCVGLILVSCLWTLLAIRGLHIQRTARGLRQQVGHVFEERFKLINTFAFIRPWVEVRDLSALPGIGGSKVMAVSRRGEQRGYTSYTLLKERGCFDLGPTEIATGDPFGLFAYRKKFEKTHEILVLPFIVELRKFPFAPGVLTGGKADRKRTTEITPHAASVRDYAPGDSLNRIHWPTTARRDQWMVKEFDQDPHSDVWIFLDAEKRIHYRAEEEGEDTGAATQLWMMRQRSGTRIPADSFEYVVSAAASIGRYFLNRGQPVGLVCNGQNTLIFQAERGERQQRKILESLAYLQSSGRLPLLGLVNSQAVHIPRGSTVILVTASGDTGLLNAMDTLLHRSLKPVVILVDPVTFGAAYGIEALHMALEARQIPVAVLKNGVSIQETLEKQFVANSG
ncbi:MAG: DUF58 domain-containing protein [Chloroflexi bacterium]|nr:DUF58 domain-containing protein [Chloroflexota bacterium]